jgi:hypothetical protein
MHCKYPYGIVKGRFTPIFVCGKMRFSPWAAHRLKDYVMLFYAMLRCFPERGAIL